MENFNNRNLAYLLAKPINNDGLEAVSGGDIFGVSSHQTCHVTGDSAQGPTIHYDVSLDL